MKRERDLKDMKMKEEMEKERMKKQKELEQIRSRKIKSKEQIQIEQYQNKIVKLFIIKRIIVSNYSKLVLLWMEAFSGISSPL